MNLDRDLRDALRPLAGDPVADAARVLGDLRPPPGPWRPWLFLAGGLLLGVALGVVWRGAQAAPAPAPATEQPAQGPEKTKQPDRGMASEAQELDVMAFGPVDLDEPGQGVQHFDAGRLSVRLGTRFTTGDSPLGAYVFANDARYRLDEWTVARLDAAQARLERGRLWLDCGNNGTTVLVDADLAKVHVEAGSGICTAGADGLEVLALSGKVVVRTARGETVPLEPQQRVRVDAERGAGRAEKVPFLGTATSWMTTMIANSSDPEELGERVREMVTAWDQGEFREPARREILKLGSRCTWVLVDSVQRHLARDRDHALATAQLLAQVVDYASATYALPLLEAEDGELRLIVFRALRARTGSDAGTDERFWQDAGLERRRTAIKQWLAELRR